MLLVYEEPRTETIRAPVLKVFDGDGFKTMLWNIRQKKPCEVAIRLGFTDAPELEQPGGIESKAFLTSLIADRWVELAVLVKMDTGGVVDRHGRIVCIPYLADDQRAGAMRNIELEMILNGWTWVLDRYGPDQSYFDALDDAQRNRRGIWAYDNNVHPWEFKRQEYQKRRGRSLQRSASLFDQATQSIACPQPDCAGHLVKRSGRFGEFWGCSAFPKCRHTRTA
jgi:endonuclease YncB( thermonuclease family)